MIGSSEHIKLFIKYPTPDEYLASGYEGAPDTKEEKDWQKDLVAAFEKYCANPQIVRLKMSEKQKLSSFVNGLVFIDQMLLVRFNVLIAKHIENEKKKK